MLLPRSLVSLAYSPPVELAGVRLRPFIRYDLVGLDDDDDTYDPATAFWTDHADASRAGSVRANSGSAAAAVGPVAVVRGEGAAPNTRVRSPASVDLDAADEPADRPMRGLPDTVYELAGNSGDYDVYEV